MKLQHIIPWGRSFYEYRDMFALTDTDLKKSILGCGDGPASFNAELTSAGGIVTSVDPIYQFNAEDLKLRIANAYNDIIPLMHCNKDQYVWRTFPSVEALGQHRMKTMGRFICDYPLGRGHRYLTMALPNLDFNDHTFELALCSHYLFLYSDQIDLKMHVAAIAELCRVAKEVRIYPLVTTDGFSSPHLEQVIAQFQQQDYYVSLSPVCYEFQKGATQMLKLSKGV